MLLIPNSRHTFAPQVLAKREHTSRLTVILPGDSLSGGQAQHASQCKCKESFEHRALEDAAAVKYWIACCPNLLICSSSATQRHDRRDQLQPRMLTAKYGSYAPFNATGYEHRF
jgi:hypothetical protein